MSQALIDEGIALVDVMQREGATLRLLGGAAVVVHCSGTPHREIGDLDAVTKKADVQHVVGILQQRGYHPEGRFNALHGDRPLIFHCSAGKLDIFVDTFDMCHKIELAARLALDTPTIPATDRLLTKLQVVELTDKDAHVAELLAHHELRKGPGDHFDLGYIAALVGDAWGLWRSPVLWHGSCCGRRRLSNRAHSARSWTTRRRAANSACAPSWASASAGTSSPTRWNDQEVPTRSIKGWVNKEEGRNGPDQNGS